LFDQALFVFCKESINQFISFSINPLQGVHHMDIEMVKEIYIQVLEVIYTTSNVTLYTKEQLIK